MPAALSWPELVVFDLAGTTVRDRGEVPEAFTAALAAAGVTVTPEALSAVRGASKREATRALVPAGADHDLRAARVYSDFTVRLVARYRADGVAPVAGSRELFEALRARGVRVVLNTGFDRAIASLLVDALGWADAVDAVITLDDVAAGRPAPDLIRAAMTAAGVADPTRVAAVGDTEVDLEAGARAGVGWNIGVLSGAHDRSRLERCPHTHLIGSVAELSKVWPELAGTS